MRRIEFAPILAAVGGIVLLVSLFLHWYQPALTAWTVFEVWDVVLAVLAVAGIWVAVASVAWEASARDGALPLLGGAAFVIVVSQLINHPPAAQGASVQSGAWLALAGSALMAAAGALKAGNFSLSVSFSSGQREGERPGPAAAPSRARRQREVQDELYPAGERSGPIGADDPELWRDPAEDETLPFDAEREERS